MCLEWKSFYTERGPRNAAIIFIEDLYLIISSGQLGGHVEKYIQSRSMNGSSRGLYDTRYSCISWEKIYVPPAHQTAARALGGVNQRFRVFEICRKYYRVCSFSWCSNLLNFSVGLDCATLLSFS
jgi:hypothetical protein